MKTPPAIADNAKVVVRLWDWSRGLEFVQMFTNGEWGLAISPHLPLERQEEIASIARECRAQGFHFVAWTNAGDAINWKHTLARECKRSARLAARQVN